MVPYPASRTRNYAIAAKRCPLQQLEIQRELAEFKVSASLHSQQNTRCDLGDFCGWRLT
jgi:hypothetical protein